MDIIIAVIIGAVTGVLITLSFFSIISTGNLRVDQSIPEDDPYIFLELKKGVSTVLKKKYVIFKVRIEDFVSHK